MTYAIVKKIIKKGNKNQLKKYVFGEGGAEGGKRGA
jgi:hypothetical protein